MNIRKPMKYKYFKTLPKDLQQEFLDWVVNTFGVSQKDVCKEMLSVAPQNLHIHIKKVGLKSPFAKNGIANVPYNREAWLKFLAGEEVEDLQNAAENHENDSCETNTGSEDTDIPVENEPKEPEDVALAKQLEEKKRLSHLCVEQRSEILRLKTLNDILQKENDCKAEKLYEIEHGLKKENRTIDAFVSLIINNMTRFYRIYFDDSKPV